MSAQHIEVIRFTVKEGSTDDQLLAAERAVRAGAIQRQAGYQGRELYRDADGSWLVIIRWDSKASGEAWGPVFKTLPEGRGFGSLLNFSKARQEQYSAVAV